MMGKHFHQCCRVQTKQALMVYSVIKIKNQKWIERNDIYNDDFLDFMPDWISLLLSFDIMTTKYHWKPARTLTWQNIKMRVYFNSTISRDSNTIPCSSVHTMSSSEDPLVTNEGTATCVPWFFLSWIKNLEGTLPWPLTNWIYWISSCVFMKTGEDM